MPATYYYSTNTVYKHDSVTRTARPGARYLLLLPTLSCRTGAHASSPIRLELPAPALHLPSPCSVKAFKHQALWLLASSSGSGLSLSGCAAVCVLFACNIRWLLSSTSQPACISASALAPACTTGDRHIYDRHIQVKSHSGQTTKSHRVSLDAGVRIDGDRHRNRTRHSSPRLQRMRRILCKVGGAAVPVRDHAPPGGRLLAEKTLGPLASDEESRSELVKRRRPDGAVPRGYTSC